MTDDTAQPHLWEIDHPYYCKEGNYYKNGLHDTYASWTEFQEEWGDADKDMNLVFRWDWQRDDGEYLEEGEDPEPDTLLVFWVIQRKAILRSTECIVTEEDEPAVRAWLAERGQYLAAIWEPFTLAPAAEEN
ncbi:hypothetical protein [Streptomyces sp. NBRC 110035]|uniref:hypothetical protein n=1 Tax=Streptomyces sp. NBRC 110035 TaxID=1547867 RepID=UPI0005AB4F7E|nr:hypothetical protein [Streptomyces sp. NBRC 110035]